MVPVTKLIRPLLAAAALTFAASAMGAPVSVSVANLRCEYLPEPLGIEETAPRLSWQLQGRERGIRQAAYQVLVASSERDLRDGRGDLWDSGKVTSDQSVHVVYRGKPLQSGEGCWWKVKVWDQDGHASGYSRPAYWEMGLLRPADWKASWIGLGTAAPQGPSLAGAPWVWFPEGDPVHQAPKGTRYFRRTLALPNGIPSRARAYLAADDDFVLYVNGKEAGRGVAWQQAQQVDVLPLLQADRNVVAIAATNSSASPAGVLGTIYLEYENGRRVQVNVDETWKASDRAVNGWNGAAFDDSAWPTARQIAKMGAQPWGQVGLPRTAGASPQLRKEFTLAQPVRRARVYISALGAYQLFLNGHRVGDEVLNPGWTDYRKRVQYRTYDVTKLLSEGANAIGAVLGDGWYAGALGWELKRNNFGPDPARLLCQVNVEYRDGSSATVVTDGTWQGKAGPILSSEIYAGESYDARRETPGWDRAGYSQGDWKPATVFTDQHPEVNAQQDWPIRIERDLPTVAVTQPKPGVFVADLGQNMVGWSRLKVRGPAGTKVTLRFAEVLNPDGTVYRDNLRNAGATDSYTLKGEGTETWEPHFTYHGFRYVELTGYPGTPGKDAITGRVFHSSMPFTSRFESSSDLVNQYYENVLWGQRGNLMSLPTDCPQRDERLGWMGDAQIFARTAAWNQDMAAFLTKWMRDIVDSQSAAGAFSDVSPRVIDPADGAPAWAEAGIVIPWTVYECYGDARILERNYVPMRRYVDMLLEANPNLLWLKKRNNDFGDWVAAGENTNKDLIASAYLCDDLRTLSRAARAIGREADAGKYGQLADRARDAFNTRFLGEDGRYTGDTQTAYVMALQMGLVPPERRPQVAERLVEAIQRRNTHLGTGFIGTKFLLPALSDTGHNDLAYRLLLNRTYPSWGYMIEKGATTIWELWNSDTQGPGMNSRNHFAFGSGAEWLQRYMAGIDTDPNAPGYRHILIRPHPDPKVSSVDASYDSIYGTISSAWELRPDGATYRITIPANTTASIRLPKDRGIAEGGRPVWRDGRYQAGGKGITGAREAADAIVFEVGSGTYRFQTSTGAE